MRNSDLREKFRWWFLKFIKLKSMRGRRRCGKAQIEEAISSRKFLSEERCFPDWFQIKVAVLRGKSVAVQSRARGTCRRPDHEMLRARVPGIRRVKAQTPKTLLLLF